MDSKPTSPDTRYTIEKKVKQFDTIYHPRLCFKYTRCHNHRANFLLIEEEVIFLASHTEAYQTGKGKLPEYEARNFSDEYKSFGQSFEFIEDSMRSDNVATNKYKYFKVVFANGVEIICTSFKDLQSQISNVYQQR